VIAVNRPVACQIDGLRSRCSYPYGTINNHLRQQMIKVSVLYPNNEGSKFDMSYYCNKHIPMVREKLGSMCKNVAVEQGFSGATPGSRPAFVAMGHLYFDSAADFRTAFGPHATTIMADIPNYTDIQPTIQISEVKI
jgi:uncharacterized protein (TIGR02118 family)